MDWQQTAAWGIVAVTAGLFVLRWRRRGRLAPGWRPCCGCSGAACPPPVESLLYHRRKGRRAEVIWRFR